MAIINDSSSDENETDSDSDENQDEKKATSSGKNPEQGAAKVKPAKNKTNGRHVKPRQQWFYHAMVYPNAQHWAGA